MPNWCGNTLTITGNKASIRKFREMAVGDGTELSLNNFIPTPTDMLSSDGWYGWRLENWGTKWDVDASVIEEDENHIDYRFDSAWSPPIEWLGEVSKQFPDLYFKLVYREDGCGFMGYIEVENGNTISREDMDTISVWSQVEADGFDMETDEGQDEYFSRLDEMEQSL
jgi:hypothetical protein